MRFFWAILVVKVPQLINLVVDMALMTCASRGSAKLCSLIKARRSIKSAQGPKNSVCREGRLLRTHHVLNECLIDRGTSPALVQLECYIDGHHITSVQVQPFVCSAACNVKFEAFWSSLDDAL